MPLTDQSLARAEELIARYPERRSALLPILFLLQAVRPMVIGGLIADIIPVVSSVDPVMGGVDR